MPLHYFTQQTLVIGSWLISAQVRAAQMDEHRTDIAVLEFKRTGRAAIELFKQGATVRSLAVGLTSQFKTEHLEVVGNNGLYLGLRPVHDRFNRVG